MPSFERVITPPPNRQCIVDIIIGKPTDNTEHFQIDLKNSVSVPALIDTGATHTSISKHISDRLELVSEGKMKMASATEKDVSVKQYQVNLHIPITKTQIVDNKPIIENINFLNVLNINVVELISHPDTYLVLLGMDVLWRCNFFMAHGKFVLSY